MERTYTDVPKGRYESDSDLATGRPVQVTSLAYPTRCRLHRDAKQTGLHYFFAKNRSQKKKNETKRTRRPSTKTRGRKYIESKHERHRRDEIQYKYKTIERGQRTTTTRLGGSTQEIHQILSADVGTVERLRSARTENHLHHAFHALRVLVTVRLEKRTQRIDPRERPMAAVG